VVRYIFLLRSGCRGSADYSKAGIDAAWSGDTVLVANGTYTGSGNRDIEMRGKKIVLRSENGPANTVIDCEGGTGNDHRGFYIHEVKDGRH